MNEERVVRGRGVLAAIAVSLLLPLCPAFAYSPMPTTAADLRGAEALDLERAGQWFNACVAYEKILKDDRSDREAQDGLRRCVRHVYQIRRHRDPTFQNLLLSRPPSQALDVYEEVLGNLRKYYLDKDRVRLNDLFLHGLEEFRFALDDETFRQQHLYGVSEEAIRSFRTWIEKYREEQPRDIAAIRHDVLTIAIEAQISPLHLNPTVVVLEFACGACNALDEHTAYLTPAHLQEVQSASKGQVVGVGIEQLTWLEKRLLITQVAPNSPAAIVGLKPSDQIVRIDRQLVERLPAETAVARLRGDLGTPVELEVLPAGEMVPQTYRLTRQPIFVPSVADIKMEGAVGSFRLVSFQDTTPQEVREAVLQLQTNGMKALILDLRGNGGGVYKSAVQIAELFIGDGVLLRTKSRLIYYNKTFSAQNPSPWQFPVVVLIDGETASSAEVLAGALKERGRATLIGQTSFGKGTMQYVLPLESLPSGIRITVAKFYSPLNHPYHGLGVTPHIIVNEPDGPMGRDLTWQTALQQALMMR